MKTLLIADHDNDSLKKSTHNAVGAALKIGNTVDVLVSGSGCDAAANEAAKISGVASVKLADAPQLAYQLAENVANLVVSLVQSGGYTHVLTASTTTGRNFMPRVAALLGVAQLSDIIAVESEDTFVRPIYAGNALATVLCNDAIKCITVRASAFDAAGDDGNSGIEKLTDLPADCELSKIVSRDTVKSVRPELTSASVVVSGGRGLSSKEQFDDLIVKLADKLGAAIGASRAAVDAGYVLNDCQVGQTGKIVAPDLYIAIGISGAIQHLAGMKEARVIVAINKDPEAPIFGIATYGLVGDLFIVVPELTESII